MNTKLNKLAVAVAACLSLGAAAQAGSMGYPEERYSATEIDTQSTVVETQPTIVERRVVTTRPTIMERRVVTRSPGVIYDRDEPGLGERIVTWPGRAARTVVRTPVIVGESLAGRREIVSDRGLFARDRDRVIYRDDDFRTTRRLSSRRLDRGDYIVRRTGDTIERGAVSTGRGVVRTGRTIVRSPVIVGETLTGQRQFINDEGRPFAR